MEYTIINSHDLKPPRDADLKSMADGYQVLLSKINDMIKQGWRPLGGIALDSSRVYFQAMIKE